MMDVITTILTAINWRILSKPLGLKMSLADAVKYTFIGVFANNFLPGSVGGDVVKVVLLGKRRNRASSCTEWRTETESNCFSEIPV